MVQMQQRVSKKVIATQPLYDDLLVEVDELTEELTRVRKELWKAQDELKKGGQSDKVLLKQLQERDQEIKMLREMHVTSIEEEKKAQDALLKLKKMLPSDPNGTTMTESKTVVELKIKNDDQEKMIAKLRKALVKVEQEKEALANCLLNDCVEAEEDSLKRKLKQARRDLQNEKTRTRLYQTELEELKERIHGPDDDSSMESADNDGKGTRKEIKTLLQELRELKEDLEYNNHPMSGSYLDSLIDPSVMSGFLSKLGLGSGTCNVTTFDEEDREEAASSRDP
jgi:chromosome segregation ATPase